ncbi:hypothetical protein [Halorussus amylolyticus]|uniref:hypothetical protein n=1 Tax=Halorussus amylolyticus TaxID=1126242 RepID=UPI001049B6A1|nr:hypothetical protein [Halorussus amylolyticus]
MATVGDHYRPTADDRTPGVYRVVGASEEVTLLRVADGRRRHTGEIRRVPSRALDAEFERADDPDAGLSPVSLARNVLQGLYWQIRQFL